MTRGELLNYLTEEAKKYRNEALASILRNARMNDLSAHDLWCLKRNRELTQRMVDALLTDFINFVGVGQCLDYDLHAKAIRPPAP